MSEGTLRRAPWAVKMALFLGAIFVANLLVGLLFQHPVASLANAQTLRYFAIMWAVLTLPYYLGWAIWKLLRRGRRDA